MTIKQQGGIFGRNPTFNDVTVDGTLTTSGDATYTNDLTVNGDLSVGAGASTGIKLYAKIADANGAAAPNASFDVAFEGSVATIANIISRQGSDGLSYGSVSFSDDVRRRGSIDYFHNDGSANEYLAVNVAGAEAGRFNSSGNLAFPSGQGIDFSATSDASGSTSELFDDYEEGTWTPTYATTGTGFDSVTYDTGFTEGTYTKIGNMVNVRMYIRTDALTVGSASGTVKIDGLPFTCASDRNAVGCYGGLFAGDNPRVARAVSDSIFLYYRTGGNTADTPLAPADMGTGANNNDVILSLCYQTS